MIECKTVTLNTQFGPFTIVETAKGVRYAEWDDGKRLFLRQVRGELACIPGLPESTAEFEDYFSGKLRVFHAPIDPIGTPFQLRCWEAIRSVPYGQTITYAQEGHRAGTRGYQAVGQANRRNPIAILIPCHRVVSANGPGGYFGALEIKRALLEFEGFAWPEQWCRDPIDFPQNEGHTMH